VKQFMKILLVFFSRTGFTERLIYEVKEKLKSRGNTVYVERLQSINEKSCLGEICKDLHHYPLIMLSLFSKWWRRRYLSNYNQVEDDIGQLQYSDVSGFDRICIGGPKWAHIAYPVARYLRVVRGLEGKQVGSVYTFGGPPLPVFELKMFEESMNRIINDRNASIIAHLGISSAYHELGIMPLFRAISRIRFCKSIDYYKLGSNYSYNLIQKFCDTVSSEKEDSL